MFLISDSNEVLTTRAITTQQSNRLCDIAIDLPTYWFTQAITTLYRPQRWQDTITPQNHIKNPLSKLTLARAMPMFNYPLLLIYPVSMFRNDLEKHRA